LGSGHGRSVLLVDDDADLRYVTNLALSRVGGFEVVGVGSVAAARESLARRVPDVILLDVELPDQDGPSFAVELGRSEALAGVPIVLLTGHVMGDHMPPHVTGAIQKPFDAMSLSRQLRQICGWS